MLQIGSYYWFRTKAGWNSCDFGAG